MADYVVGLAVFLALCMVVRKIRKDKNSGKGCSGCAGCSKNCASRIQ